jgi:hypothetical protein
VVVEVSVVDVETAVVVGTALEDVPVDVVVAPVVAVFALGAVVDVVTGLSFGGATSWRSTPPGHATIPTTAATTTTPNAIGKTSFS